MDQDPIRLLLVEDDPGDARLVCELLRQAGTPAIEVKHVARLAEAVEQLAREEPDAVLLDLSLPDAQGLDTVLRAHDAAPDVPLVVLSGLADERAALQAVRAGAQDYLVKGEITGRLLTHAVRYAIERVRLEHERWGLLQREQRARSQAEAAVRSRDAVLATVAHDLRNALAAVATTTRLLLDGSIHAGQQAHQLGVVLRSTEQMDRLIGDLLDVARIEGGALAVEPRPAPAGTLLAEAAECLAPQAADAGLLLRTEPEDDLPEVLADRRRVRQLLSNLARNAVRFTPRGGAVTLRARRFGDAVLFSVADTGVGIPAQELPHLFDRVWQAEHARRGGAGRGLAIAKGIVDAHRGRIWAASEVGRGSTFFFTLPLAPVETEGTGERADAAVPALPERPSRPVRVLVVDDHPTLRHGLVELLRRAEGVTVAGEAETGEDALEAAERLRPDVVVMDLVLPGMGGVEAARQITASMPEVRVLALTGESEEEMLMPVLRAGCSGLVRKTTAHEDLLPALAAAARDEVFLYPGSSRLLLGSYLHGDGCGDGLLAGLREQERQILLLSAEGFTSAEIGRKLFLSPKTVDTYRSRLMRRLGLGHRSELVRLALRSGLLRPE